MRKREQIVQSWFNMWLKKKDMGIRDIFAEDAVYIESWGPEYRGVGKIKLWFDEWNTRGDVLRWDIKQFFHSGDRTVVEWYFENAMRNGKREAFDGMSLVQWTREDRIVLLQEFGCNKGRYDPYKEGPLPKFRDEKTMWF